MALFLITIYFISFLIGFIIGIFLYRWDKTRNFIYKIYVKIFNQTPYKHIWEELFYELKINDKNVVSILVRTVNGDIFMGLPYLISYNPNDRAISFLELYKLNDKNKFELIINYEYLYILYYNEKRVNDLIDKLR